MWGTYGTLLGEQVGTDDGARAEMSECEIHDILRNWRRQKVIEELRSGASPATLGDLAETLAEAEAEESPAPRKVRKSVYNSLHQTHLPKLDEAGVVDYDAERKTITLESQAHDVSLYMEVVTRYGITWATYYRRLLSLVLLVVLGSEIGVPVLTHVSTVLVLAVFTTALVVSAGFQFWADRWRLRRRLLG